MIQIQLIKYLETNKLIHSSHHGYRAHHNTTTVLIEMYDTWVEALDIGELAGVCLVDLSAAFDCVDVGLLLEKMKVYGLDKDFLEWLQSYQTERKQAVWCDNIF